MLPNPKKPSLSQVVDATLLYVRLCLIWMEVKIEEPSGDRLYLADVECDVLQKGIWSQEDSQQWLQSQEGRPWIFFVQCTFSSFEGPLQHVVVSTQHLCNLLICGLLRTLCIPVVCCKCHCLFGILEGARAPPIPTSLEPFLCDNFWMILAIMPNMSILACWSVRKAMLTRTTSTIQVEG